MDQAWEAVSDDIEDGFFFAHPKNGKKLTFSFKQLPITFWHSRGMRSSIKPGDPLNEVCRKRLFCAISFEEAAASFISRKDLLPSIKEVYEEVKALKRRWLAEKTLKMLGNNGFEIPRHINVSIRFIDMDTYDRGQLNFPLQTDVNIDGIAQIAIIQAIW